jgi:hypothetical protein
VYGSKQQAEGERGRGTSLVLLQYTGRAGCSDPHHQCRAISIGLRPVCERSRSIDADEIKQQAGQGRTGRWREVVFGGGARHC